MPASATTMIQCSASILSSPPLRMEGDSPVEVRAGCRPMAGEARDLSHKARHGAGGRLPFSALRTSEYVRSQALKACMSCKNNGRVSIVIAHLARRPLPSRAPASPPLVPIEVGSQNRHIQCTAILFAGPNHRTGISSREFLSFSCEPAPPYRKRKPDQLACCGRMLVGYLIVLYFGTARRA